MTSRRHALAGLLSALAGSLASAPVWPAGRPRYGERLRLTLPIDTSRIDPHAPDLTARLLGGSLFDGLFALSEGHAVAYPALAAAPPRQRGGGLLVEIRPGLRSGRGVPLDAPAIAASLERSSERTLGASPLRRVRAVGPLEIELTTTLGPVDLASLLAQPQFAIVPPQFDPAWPDCTGALRSLGSGIKRLVRNGWAPRGGSYVEEVTLTSGDLRACLRDFETLESDVGFLGSGLHQSRSRAVSFALGPLGWAVLVPGSGLGRFGAPGALDGALGALRSADFSALGVELRRVPGGAGWSGPAFRLLVDASTPWLVAIAGELARAWDSPRARVVVTAVSRDELEARHGDRAFDCALRFVGPAEPEDAHRALFRLAGLPIPKKPLGRTSLEDAVRHLPLTLLGRLSPRGFHNPRVSHLSAPGAFDLANARFSP